jgi:hypothetical protein
MENNELFELSRISGIQFEDMIVNKEYSFFNIYSPLLSFKGIGVVTGFFDSSITGHNVVFHCVQLVNTGGIEPHWKLFLPTRGVCFQLTKKQRVKDILLEWKPKSSGKCLPAGIVDLIFQMLDFQELVKLKSGFDWIHD